MNPEELKKIPSLLKWSKYENGYPVRVDLSITNNCNLHCCFCKQGVNPKIHKNELTRKELLNIVHQGYKLGVYNWNIVGEGEPLLKADTTLDVMASIKRYGMVGNLTTNGTLFSKKAIAKINDIGWDCINFSIDSGITKVHDKLRGEIGAFQQAKNNMILFSKLKKNKTKPVIIIHSILHNQNYNNIQEMIDLAFEVNASRVDFTYILPLTKHTKKLELNKEQSEEFNRNIPLVLRYAQQKKVLTNVGDYRTGEKIINEHNAIVTNNKKPKDWLFSVKCYNPWVSMIVLANGLVGPCCRYTDDKYMGDIRTESLVDIWFGKKFQEYRGNMKHNRLSCIKYCPSTEVIRNRRLKEELIKIYNMNPFIRYGSTFSAYLKGKINNFIKL